MKSQASPASAAGVTKRRWPWIAGAVIVLLVAAVFLRSPGQSHDSTAWYEVRRGNFTISVVEPGTLAAVSEVSVRSEVEGTARIIYIVPEGSYVKKGQLIVELDSAQAEDQVNQQQINFEKAQFALIQAQEQFAIQKSTVESEIRAAELNVRFAQMDLDKFDKGQRVVDLIEASNKLVQAEAQLAVALETYSWTTNLAAKGYETKQRADSDRLSVLNNHNTLIVASNTIWLLQEFDLPKQRETYVSALLEASNELNRVIAQANAKLAQAQADLLTQSNTLVLNQRKLERDRKNLEATRIYAPQDGLVVYAVSENRFSSESLIEEGAVVRNRQEIIKLPDTSRMKVTVKVHESHVNMVRRGQPAYVILDLMPDVRFPAYVERVALLPDTQARWGNPNLKVYNTDVYITADLPDVKPGVSAKAEIIITNIADALTVPIQAVTTLRGRQVVYVQKGRDAVPTPVEVGMYNTKFIQITSGLKEGDRVLLAPPFDTENRELSGEILSDEEKAGITSTNLPPPPPVERPESFERPREESRREDTSAAPGADPSFASSPRPVFERAGGGDPGEGRPGGSGDRLNFQELVKQYDKDGDGELSEEEREAMRAAVGARFGGGGPGGQRFNREEMMRRFDADGDGELNEEEREAMRRSFGRGRRSEGGAEVGGAPAGPSRPVASP